MIADIIIVMKEHLNAMVKKLKYDGEKMKNKYLFIGMLALIVLISGCITEKDLDNAYDVGKKIGFDDGLHHNRTLKVYSNKIESKGDIIVRCLNQSDYEVYNFNIGEVVTEYQEMGEKIIKMAQTGDTAGIPGGREGGSFPGAL